MTTTMRALVCHKHGSPRDLVPGTAPVPVAGPGQVRIRVTACGINFPDLLLVEGKYQDKPPFPFIPGGEIAGIVEQLGSGATRFAVGQRVMGATMLGGLAEFVVVRETDVELVPAGVSLEAAAAFAGAWGTAWHALAQRGHLAAGETLLVLGAAGGTGIAAVQIGKVMGARVIAAAGTDAKLAFLSAQGADDVVNYRSTKLRDAVKLLTAGRGADVVFDPVGGTAFDEATRCVNWNGRLLVVGFASGVIPQFPVNLALLKGYSVVGVYYGRFREREPAAAAANMATLLELLAGGRLAPPVHAVFPLTQAGAALGCLADRTVMGKIVVRIDS